MFCGPRLHWPSIGTVMRKLLIWCSPMSLIYYASGQILTESATLLVCRSDTNPVRLIQPLSSSKNKEALEYRAGIIRFTAFRSALLHSIKPQVLSLSVQINLQAHTWSTKVFNYLINFDCWWVKFKRASFFYPLMAGFYRSHGCRFCPLKLVELWLSFYGAEWVGINLAQLDRRKLMIIYTDDIIRLHAVLRY